jgi:CSLREA domain-containing protein
MPLLEVCARGVWRGALLLALLLAASAAEALTFTVNNVGDGVDSAPGNGVCATATATCTLRAAIMEANATAIADTIQFDIAGGGPHTITPGSALPSITRPVTIDGTTEPDFGGTPVVELNGTSAGGAANGLSLSAGSGGSLIRGLAINRFGNAGITISASNGNTVEANFFGTDTSGTADLGNNVYGVQLFGGASSNVIGGFAGSGNLISGNNVNGVDITQAGTSNNRVIGNIIGLDAPAAPTSAMGSWESRSDRARRGTSSASSAWATSSRGTTSTACASSTAEPRATWCRATSSA